MMNNKRIGYLGRRRVAQGMSLIEVMLSITVLAVLVGMATPAATTIVQNSRIRGQAGDLLANLSIARVEAIKRGVYVTLCPSSNWNVTPTSCTTGTLGTSWNMGYIVFADVNKNGAFDTATDTLIAVSEPFASNTLISNGLTNTPVNELQFRPSGATNVPGSGTFKLCDARTGNVGRLITVYSTGRAVSATTSCP